MNIVELINSCMEDCQTYELVLETLLKYAGHDINQELIVKLKKDFENESLFFNTYISQHNGATFTYLCWDDGGKLPISGEICVGLQASNRLTVAAIQEKFLMESNICYEEQKTKYNLQKFGKKAEQIEDELKRSREFSHAKKQRNAQRLALLQNPQALKELESAIKIKQDAKRKYLKAKKYLAKITINSPDWVFINHGKYKLT